MTTTTASQAKEEGACNDEEDTSSNENDVNSTAGEEGNNDSDESSSSPMTWIWEKTIYNARFLWTVHGLTVMVLLHSQTSYERIKSEYDDTFELLQHCQQQRPQQPENAKPATFFLLRSIGLLNQLLTALGAAVIFVILWGIIYQKTVTQHQEQLQTSSQGASTTASAPLDNHNRSVSSQDNNFNLAAEQSLGSQEEHQQDQRQQQHQQEAREANLLQQLTIMSEERDIALESLDRIVAEQQQAQRQQQQQEAREANWLQQLTTVAEERDIATEALDRFLAERMAARQQQKMDCSICFDRNVDTAMVPCGHTLCNQCAQTILNSIQNHRNRCPICRSHVQSHMRIHLSE